MGSKTTATPAFNNPETKHEYKQLHGNLCKNGEGPIWHPVHNKFFFLDQYGKCVYTCTTTGEIEKIDLEDNICTMAPRRNGGLIVAFNRRGVGLVDFDQNMKATCTYFDLLVLPEDSANQWKVRLNDGKCSPDGRFFVGIVSEGMINLGKFLRMYAYAETGKKFSSSVKRAGYLHEIGKHGAKEVKAVGDHYCSNGPAWSNDHKSFYFVCSLNNQVCKYDYDTETGEISNKRVWAKNTKATNGHFDGSAVDSEGYIWWAIHGGSKIARLHPETGEVERTIETGFKATTALAFGGSDYKTILVTSGGGWDPKTDQMTGDHQGGIGIITLDESVNIQGVEPFYWNEERPETKAEE